VIVNCWFIKSENGLFHYSVEYVNSIKGQNSVHVLVKKNMKSEYERLLAGSHKIIATDLLGLLLSIYLRFKEEKLFTPTAHPLPFRGNQIFVIHDVFPYKGFLGKIKFILILVSSLSSSAKVGFINQFHKGIYAKYFSSCKIPIFTNLLTKSQNKNTKIRQLDTHVIGLFGSDSAKKNYHWLFNELHKSEVGAFEFQIYGTHNEYTRDLMRQFPLLKISIIESSSVSLENFIDNIDCALSSAYGEGFGRPYAVTAQLGKPIILTSDPVFREFYWDCAYFYTSIDELISLLTRLRNFNLGAAYPTNCYKLISRRYQEALDYLNG